MLEHYRQSWYPCIQCGKAAVSTEADIAICADCIFELRNVAPLSSMGLAEATVGMYVCACGKMTGGGLCDNCGKDQVRQPENSIAGYYSGYQAATAESASIIKDLHAKVYALQTYKQERSHTKSAHPDYNPDVSGEPEPCAPIIKKIYKSYDDARTAFIFHNDLDRPVDLLDQMLSFVTPTVPADDLTLRTQPGKKAKRKSTETKTLSAIGVVGASAGITSMIATFGMIPGVLCILVFCLLSALV